MVRVCSIEEGRTMKRMLLIAAFAALSLTACRQDLTENILYEGVSVFTATTESSATRTALSQNGSAYDVVWSNGDRITVVDGAGTPNVGVYETTGSETRAEFTLSSGSEAVTPDFKAYYPATLYNDGAPALPATQTYVEGNITGSPMYAESGSKSLAFKNLCGIVRLSVSTTQEGKKVRRIILRAAQGLSGAITNASTLSSNGYAATVSGTEGVTLDCGEEGVAIGGEAIPFHIAVPAGSYTDFAITVVTTDGEVQTRTATAAIEVERSSITSITLGFGELGATTGSADVAEGSPQPWVQLWPGGPKWACFNVGSAIYSYEGVTEFTHPAVTGGYYSYRGRLDSTPNAGAVEDTATELWGANWVTPTREQQQALLDNCEWTYCDGSSVQFAPGCTLQGWKATGKAPGYTENSIFLPMSGIRDQNRRARETVGSRGCFWSSTAGGSGAFFINFTRTSRPTSTVSANQPHGLSVRAICVGDDHFPSIEDDDLGLYGDLSEKETANTYIVSSAGRYKFKATVKGNGGLDPLTGETATAIDPGTIGGATVLWELQERGRAIEFEGKYQICHAGGYVYFRTPDTFVSGVACVAIFKDGEGGRSGVYDQNVDEILWSWLIWSTEQPGTVVHNGSVFMDRNLGAVDPGNGMRGFLFQWGRKDAFSAATGSYSSFTFVPALKTVFSTIAGIQSMAYTIAHPTVHINNGDPNSWMSREEYGTLPWRDDVKTIYDPCPAGWRVPTSAQQNGFSGLPGTGFSNSVDAFGNPGDGYYRTSTATSYPKAYAHRQNGQRNEWGTNPAMAIRPVKDIVTVDLSEAQSANCYLVPEEGQYMFKATVKGNGSADLGGIAKDTDPAKIAKAELVWATFNTTEAPAEGELIKDIQYKDGYVSFSTGSPYKEGNALIAVKDASDNILWSWHLWFESDDLSATAQTYPNSGYVVMDRNLGALTNCYAADNALDFGFAYQNGRKDPFMMSATRTTYTPLGVLGTYTSAAGTSTLASSILRPTVVFGTDSWGGSPDYWTAGDKTIFDPCPPGWHVGASDLWSASGFNSTSFVVKDGNWSTYHGCVFNGEAWFPASGDRWGSSHNNTGQNIRVWTRGGGKALASNGGSAPNTGDGSNPGHGYNVRCVKE